MAMLEIMSAATDRRAAALQSDFEFEKLDKHLRASDDRFPRRGEDSDEPPPDRKSGHDGNLANLTSAVAALTSRMEDVLKAQSEMAKAQSGMQKQLGDIQAAVHRTT